MRRFPSIAFLALLVLAGIAHAQPAQPPGVVVFRGATVIDAATGAEQAAMSILTRGERIERIVPAATLTPPPGAQVIDVTGLYAIPGLINSHEHLATPPNRPFAEAMMRRDLYGGVTGVRDMADDLRQLADIARAAQVGEIPGPDIDYAALMAGPEFFADPRTHAVTAGAVAGAAPWMQAVTPATDMTIAVALARGTGARAIKIYADLPGHAVAAITQEAHRQGVLVWAHAAVFPASPAEVVDAGVDAVSHACMLAYQASDAMPRAYHNRAPVQAEKFQHGDNLAVAQVIADMQARGTVLDATLWVYREMAQAHAAHPEGPEPYCSLQLAEQITAEAWRAGVTVSAGTDGFSAADDPWPALDEELTLMRDAGLTPAAVLKAATLGGAMAMGRQDEMGILEAGKLANIVFLTKDPLAARDAYRSVRLTVKRGALYWRSDYQPAPSPKR
jgi:imidazolonepropionase-like amidohydrolase